MRNQAAPVNRWYQQSGRRIGSGLTATEDGDHNAVTYDASIGRDAFDPDGEKIGTISDIHYDDVTEHPEWVAVKTGLFGTKETFVPIHGSGLHGDGDLQVAYDKAMVKNAPRIDPEGHLSAEDERELWAYYGFDYTGAATTKDYS